MLFAAFCHDRLHFVHFGFHISDQLELGATTVQVVVLAVDAEIGVAVDMVGEKAEFIESHWLGGRTSDCNGLIKGYGWFDPESGKIIYASNGMPDIGANVMFENATEKGEIETIPDIPGLAVWHEGHIGIYVGNGEVIHAYNTERGVIKTPLGDNTWTHWAKIPYISYIDESEISEESETINESEVSQ